MAHPTEPRADMTWKPSGRILTVGDRGHSWLMYDPGGRIARHLRRGRPYERQLLRAMANEQGAGGTFVDVGAHVGNHSLYMAAVTGARVHAFEPLPWNWQRLIGNRDLSGLRDRIVVHPVAAGTEAGRADWRGGRYLSLDPDAEGDVPVYAADTQLANEDDVRVVKVDVEGFESRVLAGMRKTLQRCRPIVWTESHTDDDTRMQAAVLDEIGYSFDRYLQLGSRMARWMWRMGRWTHRDD